jgi:hypothetical protein
MTFAQLVLPLLLTGAAGGGNEIVLILDNSCSMGVEARDQTTGRRVPPNDPERAAVLGTLVVEGLARGSADRVSVLAFGDGKDAPPRPARSADDIRALPYSNGTYFRRPLEEAGNRLRGSALQNRLFLFFTDGIPEDLRDPGPSASPSRPTSRRWSSASSAATRCARRASSSSGHWRATRRISSSSRRRAR